MADSTDQTSRPMTLRPNDVVTQTDPKVVRTEFTDLECHTLAELICQESDFQRLGLLLGFKSPAMGRYSRQNIGGQYLGTHKMLVAWKKKYLDYEQREQLANALDKAELISLAFKVRHGQNLES